MIIGKFIAIIIIGYLLGAIPFGLIVSKFMSGIDVREYGSGKTGATNVIRSAGKKAGILVGVFDLMKAAAAVMLAKVIIGDNVALVSGFPIQWQVAQAAALVAVVVGHNWSVFMKFRGGRGVAPFFGGLLAVCPAAALFGGEIWALTALRSRYMSMGSILGVLGAWSLLVPLTVVYQFPPIYLVCGLVVASIIVYQHRDNIARLQSGKERRLGDKGEKLSP